MDELEARIFEAENRINKMEVDLEHPESAVWSVLAKTCAAGRDQRFSIAADEMIG